MHQFNLRLAVESFGATFGLQDEERLSVAIIPSASRVAR